MISYAILMLAMHPEYQERVFEEVKLIFPDKNMDNFVNYDDLTKLEFTERVIKETMRLFPAVPVMARNATSSFDLSMYCTVIAPNSTILCLPVSSWCFQMASVFQKAALLWWAQYRFTEMRSCGDRTPRSLIRTTSCSKTGNRNIPTVSFHSGKGISHFS